MLPGSIRTPLDVFRPNGTVSLSFENIRSLTTGAVERELQQKDLLQENS
jgi:hypothetical protein